MLYLSKNDAENLQNGKVHLAQIPEFEMKYLENHLGALRLVIARCIAFFTLSFSSTFFDWISLQLPLLCKILTLLMLAQPLLEEKGNCTETIVRSMARQETQRSSILTF